MKNNNSVSDFTDEFCTVPNCETGSLPEFLDSCLEKANVSLKLANKLRIAADEVFANIQSYSGAGSIRCQFSLQRNTVTLTFSDDGIPYNPLINEEPDTTIPADLRAVGGLGILLIKRMMDSVEYRYQDGRNILVLKLQVSQ